MDERRSGSEKRTEEGRSAISKRVRKALVEKILREGPIQPKGPAGPREDDPTPEEIDVLCKYIRETREHSYLDSKINLDYRKHPSDYVPKRIYKSPF